MTILEAREKICPFMSSVVHEPYTMEQGGGVSVPVMAYCTADLCMAWEPTKFPVSEPNQGYCKLTEESR